MDNERQEKAIQRRLRVLDKQKKLRIDDSVRALLKHQQGREYLYWLLEICRLGHTPWTANALTTSFNCGEQNIGIQIQAHIIEVDPDGYLQMLREKQDERNSLARKPEPDSDTDASPSGDTGTSASPDIDA